MSSVDKFFLHPQSNSLKFTFFKNSKKFDSQPYGQITEDDLPTLESLIQNDDTRFEKDIFDKLKLLKDRRVVFPDRLNDLYNRQDLENRQKNKRKFESSTDIQSSSTDDQSLIRPPIIDEPLADSSLPFDRMGVEAEQDLKRGWGFIENSKGSLLHYF